jgi:uncharacterized Tic20 family protein
MMAHLSTLVGFFLSIPVALGFVGPGLLWLAHHRRDRFVTGQAREAVNFHASILLYALGLQALPLPSSIIAFSVVAWLALVVIVAGLAYEGRTARYPVALPIVRRLRRPRTA